MVELKQAIIVRTDLKMDKGKIAAQVAHAAITAADKSIYKRQWMHIGQKKTVLKVSSEKELIKKFMEAKDAGLASALIIDAGHTQIPPGTKTCVGIGPAPEAEVDYITNELKLL